jgi:hypothetical protein
MRARRTLRTSSRRRSASFVEVFGQGDFPLDQDIVEILVCADVLEAAHK